MNIPSKTFCILPWIHTYVNADGAVLPCCIGNQSAPLGNAQTESIVNIWNNEKYKNLRTKMLAGEECSECSACYEMERRGVGSTRESHNRNFDYIKHFNIVKNTNADGSLNEFSLKYFDVRWSNICNFKCRSCSATYSSSWATEDNSHNDYKRKVFIFAGGDNNDNLYDQFLPYLPGVEKFYFAGGEPLITDKHYEILKYLIEIGNTDVKLVYNTNLSNLEFKGTSVLDLWNKFSKVEIRASLDSWGERAEYIRDGTKWNEVEENIRLINLECPSVKMQINSTVSVFNISTIPEFVDYLTSKNLFDSNTFDPYFYNLINPSYYSADVIPDQLKLSMIEKIGTVINSQTLSNRVNSRLHNTISYLKTANYNLDLHRQFLKVTNHYDSIRNQNFVNTFPELKSMYDL